MRVLIELDNERFELVPYEEDIKIVCSDCDLYDVCAVSKSNDDLDFLCTPFKNFTDNKPFRFLKVN